MSFSQHGRAVLLAIAMSLAVGRAAQAQTGGGTAGTPASRPPQGGRVRALALDEALQLAESQSEAVQVARAGVQRARGQQMQARSQYFPQLSGTAQYTRTLASQFSVLNQSAPVPPPGTPPAPPVDTSVVFFQPCTRYLAPAGASTDAQLAGLETFARCSSSSGLGIDFSRVGFGSRNQYTAGLAGSLTLFAGGRILAQNQAASAGRRAANIELTAQRAQARLDVTQAYFDAALADRLVAIAESSLAQTESALRQTRLAQQVGNQSEFELLRAQVTRDNQVPVLLQSHTNRDLAYLRLKQLLNVPYTDSLVLTDGIGDDDRAVRAITASGGVAQVLASADTSVEARATVRELAEQVRAQEAQLRATKGERFPAIQLTSQYQKLAFPTTALPKSGSFLTNWTVSVGASVPLFTGGRIRGEELVAQANLAEARSRLEQTRELAALDAQLAVAQLRQAEAGMAASSGTAQQATRAYSIAEVRYREGISTQLELSESRVLLQQALANRAQAARDLRVAQVRLALLRDLPLSAGGGAAQSQGFGTPAAGATTAPAPGAGGSAPAQQTPQGTRGAAASISPGTGR